MKEVKEALGGLWSSFINPLDKKPIPAWEVGFVPKDEEKTFPRITYEVGHSGFGKSAILTASIWDRRAPAGWFCIVDDVANQITEKIPESGILLNLDNDKGTLWIQRSSPFVFSLDDPDDRLVVRRIINIAVHSYIA